MSETVYNYDAITGEYLSSWPALPDPMNEGSYLVPAHATTVAPPDPSVGVAHIFNDGAWTSIADHRGEVWYTPAGVSVKITALGQSPDATWTATAPEPTAAQVKAATNAAINLKIAALEQQSMRSLREIAVAQGLGQAPPPVSVSKLQSIDAAITALRATLVS
jgi:hypothetical protein